MRNLPRRPTRPDHERRKQRAISRGVDQFNTKLFFECHETLEEVWLEEPGEDFLFLQGLIQAAAALHNLHRGRRGGPSRVITASLDKLERYGDHHLGVDLARFRAALIAVRKLALRIDDPDDPLDGWHADWDPRLHYEEPRFDYGSEYR